MQFCNKLDLSICGLLITTTLFFLPGIIFLVLGFKCVGSNNSALDKTTPSDSCAIIDNETIIILLVFGSLFVFVGVLVCAFAFVVHRANKKENRHERSQFSIGRKKQHFAGIFVVIPRREHLCLPVRRYNHRGNKVPVITKTKTAMNCQTALLQTYCSKH